MDLLCLFSESPMETRDRLKIVPLANYNRAKKLYRVTCMNFIATSLNPFRSNRDTISPTRPRWTPSGFTMMKVRSRFAKWVIGCEAEDGQKFVAGSVLATARLKRSTRSPGRAIFPIEGR